MKPFCQVRQGSIAITHGAQELERCNETDEQSAVGITIESNTQVTALGNYHAPQCVEVKGSAIKIYVSTVRFVVDCDYPRTEPFKKLRRDFERRAIRAVNYNGKTLHQEIVPNFPRQVIDITGLECLSLRSEERRVGERV